LAEFELIEKKNIHTIQ